MGSLRRAILPDLAAAVSLANLSLLREWNVLLNYHASDAFFFEKKPSFVQFAAALAAVAALSPLFFLLIRSARWVRDRYGRLCALPFLLLALLPPANAVRRISHLSGVTLGDAPSGRIFLFAILFVSTIVVWVWLDPKSLHTGASIARLFAPLIVLELLLAAFHGFRDPQPLAQPSFLPLAPRRAASLPRVVWVIFDDLDYRLVFQDRPARLNLPAFDRLKEESLAAEHAFSPATITQESIPSLLTGTRIIRLATDDQEPPAQQDLKPGGISLAKASEVPSIFTSVNKMGGSSSLVGWYLPYSRLFGKDLAACSWHGLGFTINSLDAGFLETTSRILQSPFEAGERSLFGRSIFVANHIRVLQTIHTEMLRAAAAPDMNLVFIHLPVTHPPFVFDPSNRLYAHAIDTAEGYPDALVLADHWLADLRASMTSAGLWNNSTVIVTSDHHYREDHYVDGKTDLRVPFLIKLAGQTSPLTYSAPLHTIVTKPLLEAIFRREVVSPDDAVHWLAAHSNHAAP